MNVKRVIKWMNIGTIALGVGIAGVVALKNAKDKTKEPSEAEDHTDEQPLQPIRLTPTGRVLTTEEHDTINAIMVENEMRAKEQAQSSKPDKKESQKESNGPEVSLEQPVVMSDADLLATVNNGTLDELMALDKLGKRVAERIIDARPIEKLEDLQVIPYCPHYISKKK